MTNKQHNFWLISAHMGLGHMRAAYPIKTLTQNDIISYGIDDNITTPEEASLWKQTKNFYYIVSRSRSIPFIGKFLFEIMNRLMVIPPFYTKKNLSSPNLSTRLFNLMMKRKNLCSKLFEIVTKNPAPTLHTFYATSLSSNRNNPEIPNYLIVTDSDINRVWVSDNPSESSIVYCAPCRQVKKRLLQYGVPEDKISVTGFPLPIENIGSKNKLEILKHDLVRRLLRLDADGSFFAAHKTDICKLFDIDELPEVSKEYVTLMFAIGGAGAQTEIAYEIIKSLGSLIKAHKIRLFFSAGINKKVYQKLINFIKKRGLFHHLDNNIQIAFDTNYEKYFTTFNSMLRETDILWTKPSELSFYSALGIPIITAPSLGFHEKMNRKWLREIHAAIKQPGRASFCREWLFDLFERGRLAHTAWNGFVNGRLFGTYNIVKLIKNGSIDEEKNIF